MSSRIVVKGKSDNVPSCGHRSSGSSSSGSSSSSNIGVGGVDFERQSIRPESGRRGRERSEVSERSLVPHGVHTTAIQRTCPYLLWLQALLHRFLKPNGV